MRTDFYFNTTKYTYILELIPNLLETQTPIDLVREEKKSRLISMYIGSSTSSVVYKLVPSPSETWFWGMSVGGSFRRV